MKNIIPIFPSVVDNSMRKAFVRCEKMAYWQYECGFRSTAEVTIDKLAGKAFAAGLETARKAFYIDRVAQNTAVDRGVSKIYEVMQNAVVPAKSNKSPERMAGALSFYFEKLPMTTDSLQPLWIAGEPMIELSFQYKVPIGHPETGEPLTYTGRFDMLAVDESGEVWVRDEKTTGKLGDAWANQWQLDSQMSGYVDGAERLLREHGLNKKVRGAVIEGIAILKFDYEHARVMVPREPWEIERWNQQMMQSFRQWRDRHVYGDHAMALDHACAIYNSPCDYAKLCKARDPERLIEGNYKVNRWNPLTREETA